MQADFAKRDLTKFNAKGGRVAAPKAREARRNRHRGAAHHIPRAVVPRSGGRGAKNRPPGGAGAQKATAPPRHPAPAQRAGRNAGRATRAGGMAQAADSDFEPHHIPRTAPPPIYKGKFTNNVL